MGDIIGNIINILIWVLYLAVVVMIVAKWVNNRKAKSKRVKAVLVDKQDFTQEHLSHTRGALKEKKYILKFDEDGGKRLIFEVSELVYKSCKVGEKGKLVYKGTRFIDFK